MLYEEFKRLTGKDCSFEDFEKFEKMYMAVDMDKREFCNLVRSAVKERKKSIRTIDVILTIFPNGTHFVQKCEVLGVNINTGKLEVRTIDTPKADGGFGEILRSRVEFVCA